MLKIAICDDEPLMQEQLTQAISAILTGQHRRFAVTSFSNGLGLLASSLAFDLIFLDIRMPGPDGMTLARTLRRREFKGALIFVTALNEHMSDAFEVEAADYLCKPVDPDRLERTLTRTVNRLEEQSEKCLFIQTANWCKSVKFSDIYYGEVINRKIYLHTKSGIIDYYGKMHELEQQLNSHFIRCHRSFLVNPDYLQEYGENRIILENHDQIPVSRNYHPGFMQRMMEYMAYRQENG